MAGLKDGLRDGFREGERKGIVEGRRQLREEMTFELGVAEGETVIGEVPKHQFIRVAVHPQMYRPAVGMDQIARFAPYIDARVQMLTFRAVKMAWSSGNGDRFVWFTWERAR